jgi:hypothetical protein
MARDFPLRSRVALTSLFLALVPAPAFAVPLTVSFQGTISAVDPLLASAFSPGQSVSGSFQIESTAADTVANPAVGLYLGPTNFTYGFGTYTATAAGGTASDFLRIDDDLVLGTNTVDIYAVEAAGVSGAAIGIFQPSRLLLTLGDATATVFSSDAIPTSLDLSTFSNHSASIRFADNGDVALVTANLTSVAVIPEPSSSALVGLGLLALCVRRRVRRGLSPQR